MSIEELLNKLIEKGWKPFGIEYSIHIHYYEFNDVSLYRIETTIWWKEILWCRISHSLRDIASAESWLWQFVCENKLENPKGRKQWADLDEDGRKYVKYSTKFYEYRLIESALKDESELEKFLLDNIKV